MRSFRVGAVQMCATEDVASNLARSAALVAEAAAQGAELVSLPECFPFIGRRMADKLAIAESLDGGGPIVGAVRDMARKNRVWVAAGGLPERAGPEEEGKRVYNTFLLCDPDGETRAVYRKIHLFDVAIPGRAELRESATTAPGGEVVAVDTPMARLGLTICYDVRFPELYRELAAARGAEVLMVPAAFTAHTGAAHWHTLLRARAIENQCYVVAAAQHGKHNPARESYGHSIVIDPWGTVLAEVEAGDGVAVATLDPGQLATVRQQMPCHAHRVLTT
jgi:deaminated glutathione amidase